MKKLKLKDEGQNETGGLEGYCFNNRWVGPDIQCAGYCSSVSGYPAGFVNKIQLSYS